MPAFAPNNHSPQETGRTFPLTDAQAGLWFAQTIDPQNPVFNTGQYVDINGPLNVAAFKEAVRQVAMEADGLAVRILGQDRQVVDERNRPFLTIEDVSDRKNPREAALDVIRTDMGRAVDMTTEPLARQHLFRLADESFLWYQRLHHVITDGFATGLVTQRIAQIYNAALPGGTAGKPLTDMEIAVRDELGYRQSCRFQEDRDYWLDAMRDLPDVVGMKPGLARSGVSYQHVERMLDADLCADLVALAKTTQLSWPDILTALAGAYFARHVRRSEVVIGVPYMGRFGASVARVPTMVMNVLPLRLAVDEEEELVTWLRRSAGRIVRDRRHGRYRSEQVRRDCGLLGGHRRLSGPLVNVLPLEAVPSLAGVRTDLTILGTGPVDDINFSFRGDPGAGNLRLEIDTNPGLYDETETAAHGARLACFLHAAVSGALAGRQLRDIPTVTGDESRWLIETLNDTAHAVPEKTLAALIEERFSTFAASEAVRFEGRSLSYGELDQRSAALAEALGEHGAGPGAVVAVTLPRSLDLIVALIAILRAGAAYMPLDPSHPPERLDKIMNCARPVAVLQAEDSADFAGTPSLPPSLWPDKPRGLAIPDPSGTDPAYVIYTSGSTGEPKGVVVGHDAIVNRLEWMRLHYGFTAEDVILQKTPMTFDVSVWEFFLAFLCGGLLVVAPPDAHRDPVAMARIIRDNGVTTAHFVPSMLSAFLAEPRSRGLSLSRIFCSGEELTADLRDRFHDRIEAELHNLYGPTEAAVDVSYWPADHKDASRPVPIGFPVWNTRLYVLDDHHRPVPAGVDGHLFIAGRQLALEYLGQKALTEERFIADPYHPGERMYRTGDLARVRGDGAILYLGRSDHQIKLRGLRIELGEIETALLSHPAVTQAVVVLREDQPGDKRIVAYLTAEADVLAAEISAHGATRLPDYMVPSAIMVLDAFPVNGSGKLDRKALPAPAHAGTRGRAPQTESEKLVALLFARVLQSPGPLSADDDFFELGGHSLLAVELMLHLREILGREPGIGVLFEHSTIGRLAHYLDQGPDTSDAGLQPLVKLNAVTAGKPPVFMLHPAGGLSWCYNGLARALGAERPVWGVQALALDPEAEAPRSLDEMAKDYARRIQFLAGGETIHLVGWSVGGILAQAVAVRLRDRGLVVGVVAMLDSYPCDCWRDEPDPGPGAELKALLAIGGHDPDRLPDLPLTRPAVTSFLAENGSPLARLPAAALDGMMRVVGLNNRFVRAHHHRRYDGPLLHFRAAADHGDGILSPESWWTYCASLSIHEVPVLHAHMTGTEAVAHIAPVLKMAIEDRENGEGDDGIQRA